MLKIKASDKIYTWVPSTKIELTATKQRTKDNSYIYKASMSIWLKEYLKKNVANAKKLDVCICKEKSHVFLWMKALYVYNSKAANISFRSILYTCLKTHSETEISNLRKKKATTCMLRGAHFLYSLVVLFLFASLNTWSNLRTRTIFILDRLWF